MSAEALEPFTSAYRLFEVEECDTAAVKFNHFLLGSLSRLERLYVIGDSFLALTGFLVMPVFFSDHCFVSAFLGVKKRRAFNRRWDLGKLNVNILHSDASLICY